MLSIWSVPTASLDLGNKSLAPLKKILDSVKNEKAKKR